MRGLSRIGLDKKVAWTGSLLFDCTQYGWRVGRVVDPFGRHWEIGKPLGDV